MRIFIVLGLLSAAAAQTALAPLIAEAERNNPGLRAAEFAWRAAQSGVAPAGALPDPQALLQQMTVGSPLPFAGYESSDFAYTGVGVSQSLPGPGKRRLRAAAARSRADAARALWQAARRRLDADVTSAYVQLAELDQVERVLQAGQALAAQTLELARERYRTGAGDTEDVIAAQLAASEAERQLLPLRQQRASAQAELSALLAPAQDSPPIVPSPLALSPLRETDAQVLARLPAADPALQARAADVSAAAREADLARKDSEPDFMAQYMYQRTGPGFRDYYQWTVAMTLPFFHRASRQQPELEAALEHRQALQAGYANAELQDRAAAAGLLARVRADELVLATDARDLLPQARLAGQAALAAYGAGRGSLTEVLRAQQQDLQLQQDYWRTVADHELALAGLTELLGAAHD